MEAKIYGWVALADTPTFFAGSQYAEELAALKPDADMSIKLVERDREVVKDRQQLIALWDSDGYVTADAVVYHLKYTPENGTAVEYYHKDISFFPGNHELQTRTMGGAELEEEYALPCPFPAGTVYSIELLEVLVDTGPAGTPVQLLPANISWLYTPTRLVTGIVSTGIVSGFYKMQNIKSMRIQSVR